MVGLMPIVTIWSDIESGWTVLGLYLIKDWFVYKVDVVCLWMSPAEVSYCTGVLYSNLMLLALNRNIAKWALDKATENLRGSFIL